MHGQIGDLKGSSQRRDDLEFYYRTRAALIDARRLGGGTVDYDFYRMRARAHRRRVHRKIFLPLLPYVRPLAAIALLVAAIFMLPTHGSDCPACHAPVGQYNAMTSNH